MGIPPPPLPSIMVSIVLNNRPFNSSLGGGGGGGGEQLQEAFLDVKPDTMRPSRPLEWGAVAGQDHTMSGLGR